MTIVLAVLATLLTSALLASASRAADQVYWGNYNGGPAISFANLNGTAGGGELPTGTATVNFPYGIAIDAAAGRVYFVNLGGSVVSVVNLDGSGGNDLTITGTTVSDPEGIAIDPAAGRIYWANNGDGSISFANLDGSGSGSLDTTGATVDDPDGLAIDPAAGRIYWANASGTTPISFANLDGTGAGGDLDTTGVSTPSSPIGPAIDPVSGRIYWANQGGKISFANLDNTGGGGDLNTTGATATSPQGVAIDPIARRIYWADFSGPAISFADLDDSGGRGDLDTTGATPDGPTFPALLRAPSGTGAPTITGKASVGSTLTCTQGSWAPDFLGSQLYRAPQTFSYIWSRDGTQVPGATAATLHADVVGSYSCQVTAQNHAGSASQTSAPTAVGACVVPKLKGKRLKADKKKLRKANCRLGKVKGHKGGKVKKQRPKPGTVLPVDSKVNVKVA